MSSVFTISTSTRVYKQVPWPIKTATLCKKVLVSSIIPKYSGSMCYTMTNGMILTEMTRISTYGLSSIPPNRLSAYKVGAQSYVSSAQ